MFYFTPYQITDLNTLRKVRHIYDEDSLSSRFRTLMVFSVDINGNEHFIKLIDGNNVGPAIANMTGKNDLDKLPICNNISSRIIIKLLPGINEYCFTLFIGDIKNSTPQMTSLLYNYDDVLSKVSSVYKEGNPLKQTIYCIKHTLQGTVYYPFSYEN